MHARAPKFKRETPARCMCVCVLYFVSVISKKGINVVYGWPLCTANELLVHRLFKKKNNAELIQIKIQGYCKKQLK